MHNQVCGVNFAVLGNDESVIILDFGDGDKFQLDIPSALRLSKCIAETVTAGLKRLQQENS